MGETKLYNDALLPRGFQGNMNYSGKGASLSSRLKIE